MSAALIADLCVHEVRWRGLSPSAGAATQRMRSETTTNSAPWAAVTLSKQRPRPRTDHPPHVPNKILSADGRASSDSSDAVWQMPPERRKTYIHAHACPHTRARRAGAPVRQLLPGLSAKPMLTFTNPHRDRNTVIQQSVCSRKVAGSRPGAVAAFSSTRLFVSSFQINIGTGEMWVKKTEVLQWLPLLRLHFVNYCNQSQETLFFNNKSLNCRVS